jgi:hypothetical protein
VYVTEPDPPGQQTDTPAGSRHDPSQPQQTTPAEERGERIETGKTIARGGKDEGRVPGAEPDEGS